jgi:hypothetical protein
MQSAVRSYLTAGVATVGAGVIALSPIAPPMPALHLPSVHQAEVQLSAAVGPIESWVQVVQQAVANLDDIGQQFAADPAPILKQVIANQSADIALLGKAAQQGITGISDSFSALPATLQAAAKQLAAGQVVDAVNTLLAPVLGDLTEIVVEPLVTGFPVITNPMQNLTNFIATIPTLVGTLGLPILGPVYSVINAAAATVQTVIDNVPAVAVNAIINAPATLTGALLNGFGDGAISGLPAAGLLTGLNAGLGILTAGPIAALISIRDAFAQAIAPKPTTPQAALKSVHSPEALPTGGTTLTLSTGTADTATPVTKAKADKASEAHDSATVKAKHRAPSESSATSVNKAAEHSGVKAHRAKAGKGSGK